jgi:hypothetical protein
MMLIRHRAAIYLFILLCSSGALFSIWQVRSWGNALSFVDPYSEANALREVRHFLEDGLTLHYGLGTVYYPGMYPTEGFASEADVTRYGVTPEGVYTHYPPGPEYLLYVDAKLFGPEPVWRLRLLPISIGWAAMLFFGFAVRRRFGATVGWIVMAACILTPTVTDGFVGLHSQGYAFALLLVEIGISIGTGTIVAPLALLGFLQGWLSFDYVFLVAFTPLAIDLMMPQIEPGYQRRWRLAITRSLLAGGGFAAAHAFHFVQVWAYLGSLPAAVNDFTGAASFRAGAGMVHGPLGYLAQALTNLWLYYYGTHPFSIALTPPDPNHIADWAMFRFLGLSLGPWWLLITAGLIVWDRLNPEHRGDTLRFDWHLVCLTGMATTSLWFVMMVNHGAIHRHFLYRHLFLMFFFMVLFVACRLRVQVTSSWALLQRNRPRYVHGP